LSYKSIFDDSIYLEVSVKQAADL